MRINKRENNMRALVTGAAGFVGYHLITALLGHGDSVRAFALPAENTSALEQLGAEVRRGDVRNSEDVTAAMQDIDVVFHLAAIHGLWRPRQEYFAVNIGGTENVCKAALAAGVRRIVYTSSWTVYGMDLGKAVDESFPLHPFPDVYTETKAEAEKVIQAYYTRDHLPAVVVRAGTMFGPGDRVNFARMADRLRAGKAIIIGSGRNAVPFVYVSDVVDGMILAAANDQAVGQAYNLSTDQPVTQEQLWKAIAVEIGAQPPRLRVPYFPLLWLATIAEKAVKADDPSRQPLVTRLGVKLFGSENRQVIDKARRELGYSPRVPVLDGVRLTAKWYNQLSPAAQRTSG
jgi:nucleoside-diphosphate-sugar epimerase